MHDLTPFQLISLIALGAAVANFARVWLKQGKSPAARQAPPVRKAPSPLARPGSPPSTPPKPGTAPVGKQEVLPSSLDTGVAGHQRAGAAKTVKIPVVPPKGTDGQPQPATEAMSPPPATPVASAAAGKPRISTGGTSVVEGKPSDADAAALDSLFGGVVGNSGSKADAPAAPNQPVESKTGAIRRKASRLEELGFHHSIEPDDTDSGSKPAVSPAPRSSTAELTSILERIDKFLAEDTPPKATETLKSADKPADQPKADAPAPSSTQSSEAAQAKTEPIPVKSADAAPGTATKPDPNKKTQPLWARSDAQDEDVKPGATGDDKKPDEGQQRLF